MVTLTRSRCVSSQSLVFMNGLRCDVETCPRETWCPPLRVRVPRDSQRTYKRRAVAFFYDFKEDLKTNKKDTYGSTEGKKRGHEDTRTEPRPLESPRSTDTR
ncbi:hypothetical protein CgunFtcFv8_009941 [Champsocephalus gunnari]|uniref:Uncharacterized protein n=1 Tax=Champsocephalus gunnari TaxID=52237 RepID=A0AAN8C2I1_CHAGU|nr:hypothetical protein CgunFtcFv8_009941 [Champsocephalus gunnari]